MKIYKCVTWSNRIHKYEVQPLKYLEPGSQEDIVRAIREAERTGQGIRAVGSGRSFSPRAVTHRTEPAV